MPEWAWPMWVGLGIWRASAKANWERVSMSAAQRWMEGWEPDLDDIGWFLQDMEHCGKCEDCTLRLVLAALKGGS